ncbi:hypothetical protein [Shewanella colwelliana]|uniref:hypothetical protein n=1 Tax=Shewanella colwelliana TaxID=23 RepID=UPI001C7DCCA0|nr:hypothetical protein [Shewanella colwelliana]
MAKSKAKTKDKDSINKDNVDWEPDVYSLSPTREGLIDSQVFIGSMPEGSYIISSLYSYYDGGDYTSWLNMPVDHSTGVFKVKKGQLTNLGSVVFQPLLNVQQKSFWVQKSSQKAYVTRLDAQQKLSTFLLSNYPNLAESLDLSTVHLWEKDELDRFRSNLSKLSRQNAYGKTAMPLTIHGKGVIASKFGQIKWQDQQGQWHQLDLNTNSQLAAVLETDDQLMIAGERGEIFMANSWLGEWKQISRVSANEAITWFGKGENSFFAMTQSIDEFNIYQFASLESDWIKLRSFKRKTDRLLSAFGHLFPIMTKSGQLSVLNDNKLFEFNHHTSSWSEQISTRMSAVSQLANGYLVGIERSYWGAGEQVISLDSGKTWLTVNRDLMAFDDHETQRSLPVVFSDGTVVTLGRKKTKAKDKRNLRGELKVISTTLEQAENNKSWSYHGNAVPECETLLAQISSADEIYFLCDKGDVIFTQDLGQSWQHVIKIDIADMQLKFNELVEATNAEKLKQQIEAKSKESTQL